jgi:hypothetical protein
MDRFHIGDRKPLFFMHIPKTAGMSMRLYLSGQYQVHDVCPAVRWHGLLGREQELRTFRLVQGHFRYNLRELLPTDARTLVLLRDPIRRTVSALRHMQRDPDFHLDHRLAKDLTISEMLRYPRLMRNQRNIQACFLCASMRASDVSSYLEQEVPRNPDADAADREKPPELELAKERLASIDFVGLTENIGAVVPIMAREMSYHPPLYFPFVNEDPARTDPLQGLNDEDLAILNLYNDIDLPLYRFAQRQIERRAFENSMCELTQSGTYQVPVGSFEIAMSDIIPGSGWYEHEQHGDASWRWTGPSRYFTIEVPLRTDVAYRLVMTFGGSRAPALDDITAEVNDLPVAFAPPQDGCSYRLALTIPKAMLARCSGFCRIRFDTHKTGQLGPSDIRTLGVVVRKIFFECLES